MVEDVVDHNQEINGHSITVGWLLESLRENDKSFQKLHGNRNVKEVTFCDVSGGKGFVSEILRCTLTFVDSKDPSDIYTTILKIPSFASLIETSKDSGVGDEGEKQVSNWGYIHEYECAFYKDLAPMIDIPMPIVFKMQEWIPGIKQDGCIHMEDLTQKGKTLSFFENINLSQVKCFIRNYAKFHKNILSADPKLWQGKYLKSKEALVNVVNMIKPIVFDSFLPKCQREDDFKKLLDKYGTVFENKDFLRYAVLKSHENLGIKPVLLHGDMHLGNIMWNLDEEGDVQNDIAAIIDWQGINEGSPMTDLVKFLLFACDGVVRRQAEEFAVEYYLECLTKEFDGDSSNVPYTAEQLKKSYNYMFLAQVFMVPAASTFLLAPIEKKEPNKILVEAYLDIAVFKSFHGLEDAARLLDGEMKDVFEKYDH